MGSTWKNKNKKGSSHARRIKYIHRQREREKKGWISGAQDAESGDGGEKRQEGLKTELLNNEKNP